MIMIAICAAFLSLNLLFGKASYEVSSHYAATIL